MSPPIRVPMHFWSTVLAVAAAAAIAILAAFFIAGPERIWALFGPADLGPVNFETLKRRTSPNDLLACPQNICIAKSDLASPIFAVSAPELQKAFAKVIASEPSVEQVASDDSGFTRRYVQRTKIMRFPDTIVVRFIDLGDGRSTIALYSRSQLGESDFGVNHARIERWLEQTVERSSGCENRLTRQATYLSAKRSFNVCRRSSRSQAEIRRPSSGASSKAC